MSSIKNYNTQNIASKENSMEGKLIFNKYRVIKFLSEEFFGKTYLVQNLTTSNYYTMKMENKTHNISLLDNESYFLYKKKLIGIPELITCGVYHGNKVVIEENLGKSLQELFQEKNYRFSIQDVCLISIQLIERIKWVHSKKYIHRDIKPENFYIGIDNPDIIYITNFYLCLKYCSSKTGKHIAQENKGTFTGTLKYASVNAQRGYQLSRRDDMESLGYTILFFLTGSLPWQINIKNNDRELYLQTYKMKKYMPIEKLCRDLPNEIYDYFKYVKGLKFQEEPDYDYLSDLFICILKNRGIEKIDNLSLSWASHIPSQNMRKASLSARKKRNIFRKIKENMISQQNKTTIDRIKVSNNNNNFMNIANRNNSVEEKRPNEPEVNKIKADYQNPTSYKLYPNNFKKINMINSLNQFQIKNNTINITNINQIHMDKGLNKNIIKKGIPNYNEPKITKIFDNKIHRHNNYPKNIDYSTTHQNLGVVRHNISPNLNIKIRNMNSHKLSPDYIKFQHKKNFDIRKELKNINNIDIIDNINNNNFLALKLNKSSKLGQVNKNDKRMHYKKLILNYHPKPNDEQRLKTFEWKNKTLRNNNIIPNSIKSNYSIQATKKINPNENIFINKNNLNNKYFNFNNI